MERKFWYKTLMAVLLVAVLALAGCSGDDGAPGPRGPAGPTGPQGDPGSSATVESCSICHGVDRAFSVATYMDVNEYTPNFDVTIDDVRLLDAGSGAGSGGIEVDFTVGDGMGGTPDAAALAAATSGAHVAVAKLVQQAINTTPATIFYWQDYYNSLKGEDGPGFFDPDPEGPTKVVQATGATCVLTDNGGGSYTCADATDLTNITVASGDALDVAWEPALTHRVAIYFGSHVSDPAYPGNGWVDLVPNGLATDFATAKAAVVDTRDVATTASCNECHGKLHGHGGDRVEVAICVVCHNPGTTDPDSGMTMDMANMIHSIHLGDKAGTTVAAGTAHAAITGGFNEDGAVLRADDYIVGHRGNDNNFSEIGYPNRLDNCLKCHDPADAATPDGGNPLTAPSERACVSCHDQASWDATHSGRNDSTCVTCHSGAFSVEATHEFTTTEYVTTITMEADGDADGIYEEGDAPLITITVADGSAADVGGYTDADYNATTNPTGTYNDARVYIYGPRSKSAPVLATGTQHDPDFVAALALDDTLTPEQSHELYVGSTTDFTGTDVVDPLVMTDATGFKYQTLAIPADMTPGTYMVMARIGVGSSSSERAWAIKTFQVGTATVQDKVSGGGTRDALAAEGGCESCHNLEDYSSTAHRAFFGTDGCLACHDQSGNHADPLANRVHAVHAAASMGDLAIESDTGLSRDWSEVTYPQIVSHCKTCHTSGNTSFQSNPLGFACVGCHGDTPDSKDHMVQMGADFDESFLTEEP